MKKQNITIADLVHVLGLVVLGVGVFFGSNYFFEGKFVFSILVTAGIILLLAGLVYVISTLKRAEKDQQTKKIAEVLILILGYGSVSALAFIFLAHFVNIEFGHKEALKTEARKEVRNISEIYERFTVHVNDKVLSEYKVNMTTAFREGNGDKYNVTSLDEIDERIGLQKRQILGSKAFSEQKKIAKQIQNQTLNEIEQWNPILIAGQINSIPEKIEVEKKWLDDNLTSNNPLLQEKPFEFNYIPSDKISKLKEFNIKETNWVVVLPIFIILILMILWPYFATSRHRVTNVRTIREDQSTGIKL